VCSTQGTSEDTYDVLYWTYKREAIVFVVDVPSGKQVRADLLDWWSEHHEALEL